MLLADRPHYHATLPYHYKQGVRASADQEDDDREGRLVKRVPHRRLSAHPRTGETLRGAGGRRRVRRLLPRRRIDDEVAPTEARSDERRKQRRQPRDDRAKDKDVS